MKKIFHLVFILIFSGITFCGDESALKNEESTGSSETENKRVVKENPYATEVAAYLAGINLESSSSLNKLTLTPEYQSYKREINTSWQIYRKKNLDQISLWRKNKMENIGNGTVFYPFSGPDILHATAFFPEGKKYILLALEKSGPMPDPRKVTSQIEGLHSLKAALTNILGMGFFHTNNMAFQIAAHEYSSITAVLMFFLARTGNLVVAVNQIYLDDKGYPVLQSSKPPQVNLDSFTTGVEIVFKKADENIQRFVYYFRGDISDLSLHRKIGLIKMIRQKPGFTTFLKAASYLMYNPRYDDIRELILSGSSFIVTDTSGIPLHYFHSALWDRDFYGSYNSPIPLFANRCQPDLRKIINKKSKGALPFSFGYQFRYGQSHLMIMKRKATFDFYEPELSGSEYNGSNTTCIGDQLYIVSR